MVVLSDQPIPPDRVNTMPTGLPDAVAIRPMAPGEEHALSRVYQDSVSGLGPAHYSPEQVAAWASFGDEREAFTDFVCVPWTVVAEDESGLIGFAGFEDDGHVPSLYVRHDRARRGVGSQLLEAVLREAESRGMDRLYAEASLFSKAVFERHGFVCERMEHSERRGVLFDRFLMARNLSD